MNAPAHSYTDDDEVRELIHLHAPPDTDKAFLDAGFKSAVAWFSRNPYYLHCAPVHVRTTDDTIALCLLRASVVVRHQEDSTELSLRCVIDTPIYNQRQWDSVLEIRPDRVAYFAKTFRRLLNHLTSRDCFETLDDLVFVVKRAEKALQV